jgi:hypothetical protein
MVAESTMPTIYVCCARISGKMVHQLLLLYLLAYALLEAACAAGASVVKFFCAICLLPVFITLQHNSPHHVHHIYLCSFCPVLYRAAPQRVLLGPPGRRGLLGHGGAGGHSAAYACPDRLQVFHQAHCTGALLRCSFDLDCNMRIFLLPFFLLF